MKPRKIPVRKCVACGEQFPKKELLRVVLHPEEGVVVDPSGKKNGRGAYLCRKESCVQLAKKARKLQHALKTTIEDDVYEEIMDNIRTSE